VEILRSKGYRGPSAVVPNAVDANLFRPLDRAQCREELGVSGFAAGYVGRLVEEKGLMDMVNALEQTPADVNLLFVGAGPYQPALEQRVRERGWEARVRFLPPRPLEQLPQVMNALDALVLPSRTTARWKEQFGRVLIEAQACQTPVIGSDSGAIPEVIGSAGMIVPEGSAEALACATPRSAPGRWDAWDAAAWRKTTPGRRWRSACVKSTSLCWMARLRRLLAWCPCRAKRFCSRCQGLLSTCFGRSKPQPTTDEILPSLVQAEHGLGKRV